MKIQTFDLVIWYRGYVLPKIYYNISRAAVKQYIDWHKENPKFIKYAVLEA